MRSDDQLCRWGADRGAVERSGVVGARGAVAAVRLAGGVLLLWAVHDCVGAWRAPRRDGLRLMVGVAELAAALWVLTL